MGGVNSCSQVGVNSCSPPASPLYHNAISMSTPILWRTNGLFLRDLHQRHIWCRLKILIPVCSCFPQPLASAPLRRCCICNLTAAAVKGQGVRSAHLSCPLTLGRGCGTLRSSFGAAARFPTGQQAPDEPRPNGAGASQSEQAGTADAREEERTNSKGVKRRGVAGAGKLHQKYNWRQFPLFF